jgi:hypothetical protein
MGRQFRDNLVAITSLVVALSALGYNTWRNERTERNRNVRVAGIEMLKEIGSLQQIVFHVHFVDEDVRTDPSRNPSGELRMGWVDVLTIKDLAVLMPPAVVREASELDAVWKASVADLVTDDDVANPATQDAAFRRIDEAIDGLRQETLSSLRALR